MVRVPDSRQEGPGSETQCWQVSGLVLIQPLCQNFGNFIHPISIVPSNQTGQHRRVGQQHQHAKNYKAMAPSPQRVYDQGGGSDQHGLCAGGAKNIWVKKNSRKRVSRLQRQNSTKSWKHTRTQKEELRETRLVWGVTGIGEVKRQEEYFTTLQSGHLPMWLPYTILRQKTPKQE